MNDIQKDCVWKELKNNFKFNYEDIDKYDIVKESYIFDTYEEYKKKKMIIARDYSNWNKQKKAIYKLFVFSRIEVKEKQKETIWADIHKYGYMMNNMGEIYESSSEG